ncbi:MAG TPA: GNAT family N-acetyltransferase [Rhizomicrobium sp.]|nr:GNAT family N-acetyltransferase [Rhizomicrobium sp.]
MIVDTNAASVSVNIAPMTVDQAEETSCLFRDVLSAVPYYNQLAKETQLAKYTAARLISLISLDPGAVLIATIATGLIGYCISEIDDGTIWLDWFGVRQDFRRKGLGFELLKSLERRCRTTGTHKIWCDSRANNIESADVLMRSKFKPLCTIDNHWYGQDFILWEKVIA